MNKPPVQSSTSSVISSYRRRRQRRGPSMIFVIAGILILGGVILLIVWLSGPDKPIGKLFATETPTPTITPSPTNTNTPTLTLTVTSTATITASPTFSAPFNYTVQEGDYLALIVDKFSLGDDGVALILLLNPYNAESLTGIDPTTLIVNPGQVILLPYPGMPLPTATAIPSDLPRGTKLDYIVQAGDSLAVIAAKFNSTEEDIIKENSIEDANAIFVGQILVIPVNMVTPTATRPPTSTPVTPGPGTQLPTVTITPIN